MSGLAQALYSSIVLNHKLRKFFAEITGIFVGDNY